MSGTTCPHCGGAFTIRLVTLDVARPTIELRPRRFPTLPPVMGHYRPVYTEGDHGQVIGFECCHCEGAIPITPGESARGRVLRARTQMIQHLRKEHANELADALLPEPVVEDNGRTVNLRQIAGGEFDTFVQGLDLRGRRT